MGDTQLVGVTHVSFSVRDLDRSLGFYRDVLGLRYLVEPFDGFSFEGREAILVLSQGTVLCLQQHRANSGEPFDARRTGLDHLAFAVGSLGELEEWASRLTAAGVEHSGVKPLVGFGSMIELRDPDGIQLELHCRKPA